jgi:glycosyltransferase involved in cell wall biosynthesis
MPSESTPAFDETKESPLRCLWLTRVDPTQPDAGDLSYSFNLVTSLGRSGVKVTVLAAARAGNGSQRPAGDGVEWRFFVTRRGAGRHGRSAVWSLFSALPNVAASHKTVTFQRELRAQLGHKWDAVVVDHLGMGWAWPAVEAYRRRNPDVVSIFVAHGYESEFRRSMAQNFKGDFFRKLALRVDAVKAARLERKLARSSTFFSVITSDDRHRFGDLANSVVLTPGYGGVPAHFRAITATTPRRVLMFGSALWLAKEMNLVEFIEAADEMFSHNQIELWVVGKVSASLRANNVRATRFLGFVEDPRPIFCSARVGLVAERTGGGFKLKTLDYIFNRVPIAAIKGSIAGLPLEPKVDYLSFETMHELAQGIVAVIDDIERLNSLQRASYEKCVAGFNWSDRGRILRNAIQQAVNRQSARARRPSL